MKENPKKRLSELTPQELFFEMKRYRKLYSSLVVKCSQVIKRFETGETPDREELVGILLGIDEGRQTINERYDAICTEAARRLGVSDKEIGDIREKIYDDITY